MKVDLPTFLVGLFLFISATGMVCYLVFTLLYDDTNYDDYPIENMVFGFSLMILAICIMFFMGSHFFCTSEIKESPLQSTADGSRK